MSSFPSSDTRLLAISDAAPSRNGAGAYYQDLLEQLQDRLAAVRLYSPTIDEQGKWQAGLVLPLPGDKTQKLCFPNFIEMQRLFDTFKPHIVVIATPGVFGMAGAWLSRRRQIPYLTGMHTSFEQLTELYWPDSLQGKIVEKYFSISNGFLFRHTEAVLGNAEPILEQAQAMGAPATRLMGTPLSSEFILPPVQAYSGKLASCLFAGRLAQEKNIGAILDAVAANADMRFSIAGDGPLRPEIDAAVAKYDNLDYLGWLSRHELRQAVDAHDALLLPSHFETFGTIALEAMARERLVFVSTGCGITHWERLRPGLSIIGDAGLAASLAEVKQQPGAQRQAVARLGASVARAWNNDVIAQWERIIQDTLAAHGNRPGA